MGDRSLQIQAQQIQKANHAFTKKGITQAKFALSLDLSRSTVSNFLHGKSIYRENFIKICNALNLDLEEVTGLTKSSVGNAHATESTEEKEQSSEDITYLVNQLRKQVQADIETRCGTMRIFDMTQPIGLGKIYTQVNILEKISRHRRKKITELIRNFTLEDFDRFNFGKIEEKRILGKDAVSKHNKLFILGKPGAGKTTFLKHLAIQCNEGEFQGDLVPFFVTLKDFAEAEDKPNLLAFLGRNIKDRQNLTTILSQQKALILLDGLDEVLEADSKRVIREIEDLSNTYPHNQYVLTCRIAAREYTFEKFTEVEIADFDWEQITIFARKWFQAKPIKPEKFLTRLEKDEPIKELVANPLLLTLLCISFEELGDFPANRKELYEEGLNALLRKWDASQGKQRDKVYKPLSIAKKEDLLSNIAWKTFAPGEYFFKTDRAKSYISEYIRNLPGANLDDEALQGDSEIVLKNIEAQHGLLVARARHIYSFSHLTFQEYFTAREIILVQQSSDTALAELVSHLFDPRWREVFLLAVAMSPNAERLALLMKQKIDLFLADKPELQEYLVWLNRKASKEQIKYSLQDANIIQDNYKFYASRDLALSRIIYLNFDLDLNLKLDLNPYYEHELYDNLDLDLYRNLDLDLNLYLNLDFNRYLNSDFGLNFPLYLYLQENLELAKEQAHKLYVVILQLKRRLPDAYQTNDAEFRSWWEKHREVWLQDFWAAIIEHRDIGHDWQFNDEQKSWLEKYSVANQLLTQCLHQDCYVSPEVRQEIEETLLLPIAEIEKRK